MQFDTAHRPYPHVAIAYKHFIEADAIWSPDEGSDSKPTEVGRLAYYTARQDLVDAIYQTMPPVMKPVISGSSRRKRVQLSQLQTAEARQLGPIYPVYFIESAISALGLEGFSWRRTRFYIQPDTTFRKGANFGTESPSMFVNETGQGYLHLFYNVVRPGPMARGHSHAVLAIGRGPNDSWSVDAVTRHHQR